MSVNLARKEGCYAYELWKEFEKIEQMTYDNKISLEALKTFVHSLADKAKVTTAQKKFIKNINEKTYKKDILYYCNNVVNKAELPLRRYY